MVVPNATIGIYFPGEHPYLAYVYTARLRSRVYFRFTARFDRCLRAADNKNGDKERSLLPGSIFSAKYMRR